MVLQAGTAYEDEAGFVAKSVQRVADHPTGPPESFIRRKQFPFFRAFFFNLIFSR